MKSKKQDNANKDRKKWIIYMTISFISNAILVVMPIFFKHESAEIASMSGPLYAWAFIFALVMMIPIFALSRCSNKEKSFKLNIRSCIAIIIAGITLVLYNYLSTIALNYFPGSIIYPVRNGLIIVMNFLVDMFFYRTKITIPQWLGAALAIVAIVFLNL